VIFFHLFFTRVQEILDLVHTQREENIEKERRETITTAGARGACYLGFGDGDPLKGGNERRSEVACVVA